MTDTASLTSAAPMLEDCRLVELRDYLMQPRGRDVLVELFDREFVETQEAVGMRVIAQFVDLDRPDRFVWLRGFADMASRRAGLAAFYGGPAWAAHRSAANTTMIDSSDVRLLRPSRTAWAPASPAEPRARPDAPATPSRSLWHLDLCVLRRPADARLRRRFDQEVLPVLAAHGAAPRAVFETEPAENDFPQLPVRTDAPVFAWLTRHADEASAQRADRSLAADRRWTGQVLAGLLDGAVEVRRRRLRPTDRSLLR